MQMSPAKRRLSKAAVWTVNDMARLIEIKKNILIKLFIFLPLIAYDLEG